LAEPSLYLDTPVDVANEMPTEEVLGRERSLDSSSAESTGTTLAG
jgi:hypothetical protein